MISLRIHTIADYVVGALLVVSPWLFGFFEIPAARTLFLIAGLALVVSSLLTNSYFSVLRIVPLGLHMTVDTILGVLLILAPALFDYRSLLSEGQSIIHVVLGVLVVGLVAFTRPRTEAAKTVVDRAAIQREHSIRS